MTTQSITHASDNAHTEQIILDIDGMTCQACASRIEKVLNKKPAIVQADVNYANEVAQVQFDASQTNAEQIVAWVKKTGYEAKVQRQNALFAHEAYEQKVPYTLIAVWICLLPFFDWHGRHDDRQSRTDAAAVATICVGNYRTVWLGDSVLQKCVGEYQRRSCQYGRVGGAGHTDNLGVFDL